MCSKLVGAVAAVAFLHSNVSLISYCSDFDRRWNTNWDYRAASSSNGNTVTATRHIILIRHGQYVVSANSNNKVLTELGRHQAKITGLRLQQLGLDYAAINCSTMIRAQETAKIIVESLPNLPLNSTDLLCEGSPIKPDPCSSSWDDYKRKPWHVFQDGARIEYAFRHFFHRANPDQIEDSFEILVCHANVIRYFICRALQIPPEAWLRLSIGHCGISWITIRPNGSVKLKKLSDTGHLPPNMLTFS